MRHLAYAAVCGTLVLAACSDQTKSPTEPSLPPPAENFGTTCSHGRYPARDVALLVPAAFPATLPGYRALRAEALLRIGAIAVAWDFCQDRLARQIALKSVTWIKSKVDSPAGDALIAAILNGLGGSSTSTGDYVSGVYIPNGGPQYFTTPSGRATLKLGDCAFSLPTLITVRRLPDDFRLSGFPPDRQDSPFWDYDATNSSTDNTLATHLVGSCTPGGPPDADMAFCFRSNGEGGQVSYPYPGARIGHNPVGGGFELVEDEAIPGDLQAQLTACGGEAPILRLGSSGGGVSGRLANLASSAGHYLANLARTLFLPAPLRAATVGTLGPIAGKPASLSPFGIVLADCPGSGYYTYFCLDYSGLQ